MARGIIRIGSRFAVSVKLGYILALMYFRQSVNAVTRGVNDSTA